MWFPPHMSNVSLVSQLSGSALGQAGLLKFPGFTQVWNDHVLSNAQHPSAAWQQLYILMFLLVVLEFLWHLSNHKVRHDIGVSPSHLSPESCDLCGRPHLLRLAPQLNPKLWISNGSQSDSPYECISCDVINPMVRALFASVLAGEGDSRGF